MDDPEDLFTQHGPVQRPAGGAPLYADVVVRQRARAVGTFSYAVPPALRDKIAPGQAVWVPFRQGRLPAIVVALSEQAPRFATRPVDDLIDARPVLSETQLALGRWLADYYLCSLAEALFAMVPPGLLARTRTFVGLTEAGRSRSLDGLAPSSRRVIEVLREAGDELDAAALLRNVGSRAGAAVDRLARHGWLTLRTAVEEPEARPHLESFLVLTAPPDAVEACRARLLSGRRNPPAARVLEALARAPGGALGRQSLLREVKAAPAALAALEEEGLLRSTAEQRRLHLVAMEEDVETFPLPRAPREVALVYRIRDAGGVIDVRESDAPAEVRRSLIRRGLLREELLPARVRLAVLPEVALERAAALRRAPADERQSALLAVLAAARDRALPVAALLQAVPGAGRADVAALVEAGVARQEERELLRDPLAGQVFDPETPPPLTEHQGRAWRELYDAFGKSGAHAFLLHGVTGSGKTEIYLRALGRCLREGRQALVLVPEISLTPQTVRRFLARFPARVTVLHSGLAVGERYDQWRRVRDGQVDVVIGPRSALFAPLPRLGLIVVDEEHESSYKQDDLAPRYHARETALALARITGSVVVLGSATPAVESYARAERGVYRLLELPERIRVRQDAAGVRQALIDTTMPLVQVVDMRQELRAGNLGLFSRPLQAALQEVLAGGEQAILFLNRRGAATFVMCRECGYVARCPRCEVPLVLHAEDDRLLCHRCGRKSPSPRTCPQCGSSRIRHFGAGTERVVAEVERLFPHARVLRWDRDATRERGAHDEILAAFVAHQADVLVGTQMVTKGLDLPLVTLVGVVSADTSLHLPDFRSAERTFQLLTQVIGRAGRRAERGRAIIQTYHPDNEAVQAAARQDYAAFFRQELAYRQRYGYPPCAQLARLVYSHSREKRCQERAAELADVLRKRVEAVPGARLIGPAPAFLARQRGLYRWQVLLLAPDVHPVLRGLDLAEWTVDVDPASLLT